MSESKMSTSITTVSKRKHKIKKKEVDAKVFSLNGTFPNMSKTPSDNAVYKVVGTYEQINVIATSLTLQVFNSLFFSLNLLNGYTDLQAVFDQYRLDEVECWIIPRFTSEPTNTGNPGLLSTVVDYDDSTALSTVGQALDYANCLTSSGLNGHYRRFRPHIAMAAYSGAFSSYANREHVWLDSASAAVQHYGLKTANTTTDVIYHYDLIARLHFSFRNSR